MDAHLRRVLSAWRAVGCLAALAVVSFGLDAAAQAPLGDKNMAEANRAASTVVKERLKAERPEDAKVLQQVQAADIVVVAGEYDRVEQVLRALDLKHTVVQPVQVAKLELNAKQLLIVDCPGNIGPRGIERIQKFVNAGGYLYTTDWALVNVVQKAFPGFVKYNGRGTGNDVVEVEVREAETNLLKHLKLSKENPKWWLEADSYPIRVLDPDKVDVLVTSREMKKKYGESPIAVHFRYGDGQVLHIASHFYLQQNQTRSVAEKKKAKDFVATESTLAPATKAALKNKPAVDFSDDVVAGDLGSAYTSQQMTTNIVLDRKRDQERVEGLYKQALKKPVPQKGPSAQPVADMPAGTRVKELERKDGNVKVRTMTGEEAWVPADAL